MRGPYEGFGAAGAFQSMQPEHRHPRLCLQRMGHLRSNLRRETKGGGGQTAKFHETAARDALPPQDIIECFRHDRRSSSQNAFSRASADRAALLALGSKSCAKPQLAFELNSLRQAIHGLLAAFGLQSFSGGSHIGNESSPPELIASADTSCGGYDCCRTVRRAAERFS